MQAGGGASSSESTGSNRVGVNVSLAGLGIQVFTLLLFIGAAADFLIRFIRSPGRPKLNPRVKIFLTFLFLSILLILIRCVYRIDELSDGYSGSLFRNEGVFIGLEGVYVLR